MSSHLVSTYAERQSLRAYHKQQEAANPFLHPMPKLELHVHLEGTLSPTFRWKLSQRNNIPLTCGSEKVPLTSLTDVQEAHGNIRGRIGAGSADSKGNFTFYEAYYGGMELLRTEEDFFDLAKGYFERASTLNIRSVKSPSLFPYPHYPPSFVNTCTLSL